MNEVRFEIPQKRFLRKSKTVNVTAKFPTVLDELTSEQFLFFFQLTELDIPEIERRILFLHKVSGLKTKYFLRLREGDILTLTELLNFLNLNKIEEAPVLTKSLLPDYKIGGVKYTGPSDMLNNIVFLQFAAADMQAESFAKTKSVDALDNLFSVLYSNGKFDKNQDELMLPLVKKIPAHIKVAALFNFICLKAYLPVLYPDAFSDKGKDKKKKGRVDYQAMKVHLAGNKFGTVAETEQASLHDIFKFIDENEKQNKEE